MRHHYRHHPVAFGAPVPSLRASQAAAFAEGRRMREQARRRRRSQQAYMSQVRRSQARRHQPANSLLLILLAPLLLAVVGALGAGMVGLMMLTAAVAMGMPVLVVGTGIYMVTRRQQQHDALHRAGAPGMVPMPPHPPGFPQRPVPPHRPDLEWGGARQRFHALRDEYAAFECDPMQVLRLPALADVSVPSTARFVDAFAEAQALETDLFPPGPHAAQFVAAADHAERAWQAARDAAERIRLSNLSPAERSSVERVVKLLTTARDSDSEPERLAAYSLARSELAKLDRAGVIHMPRTAQAALDAAAQSALPPARESA